jgi:protein SCO1
MFLALRTLTLLAALLFTSSAFGQVGVRDEGTPLPNVAPAQIEHVAVKEHLDSPLPLGTPFTDTEGKAITLGELFNKQKPRVLVFAYHSCPQQCSMVLRAVTKGLSSLSWSVGKEYDLIVISIDPKDGEGEGLLRSKAKRALFLAEYKRPEAADGTHFLQGTKESIDAVTRAVGFEFEFDRGQYNHPSVIMLTKQNGDLARYLYGLEYVPNDLKLGLLEASEGRSITTVEQFMIYCFTYDPKGAKYVLVAWRVMRIGGAVAALLLASFLALLWRRELRKKSLSAAALPTPVRV